MIPSNNKILSNVVEFENQSSYTFYLDIENNNVVGFTDKLEAMKQAVYLILQTERYKWVIFSWNYGIEITDFYGKSTSWVIPEVKRRIQEALLQDERITSVDNFDYEIMRSKLMVYFTVNTIYGKINEETEVIINV